MSSGSPTILKPFFDSFIHIFLLVSINWKLRCLLMGSRKNGDANRIKFGRSLNQFTANSEIKLDGIIFCRFLNKVHFSKNRKVDYFFAFWSVESRWCWNAFNILETVKTPDKVSQRLVIKKHWIKVESIQLEKVVKKKIKEKKVEHKNCFPPQEENHHPSTEFVGRCFFYKLLFYHLEIH